MTDSEEKYALEYHTADDPDPQGPPFKYRSHYLDDVLAESWRLQNSGGRALCISQREDVVFDKEALDALLSNVSAKQKENESADLRELAREALAERAD